MGNIELKVKPSDRFQESKPLPYDPKFSPDSKEIEQYLLASVIKFPRCFDMIKENNLGQYFLGEQLNIHIYKGVSNFYDKKPDYELTEDVLWNELVTMYPQLSSREHLHRPYLKNLYKLEMQENWIIAQIEEWGARVKMYHDMERIKEMLDSRRITEAKNYMFDASTQGGDATTRKDLMNLTAEEWVESMETAGDLICPTGITALDKTLKGIFREEVFVIFANLNVGKSYCCEYMAAEAVMKGKNVLYFDFEMSENRLLERFFKIFYGSEIGEMDDKRETYGYNSEGKSEPQYLEVISKENKKRLESLLFMLKHHKNSELGLIAQPTRSFSIADIEREIKRFELTHKAYPDIIFIDPFYNLSFKGHHTQEGRTIGLGILIDKLKELSVKHRCGVVVTHQANREGAKGNQKNKLGVEYTSASYEIAQKVDTMIALTQNEEQQKFGIVNISVERSRHSQKYTDVTVFHNLALGKFHQYSIEGKAANNHEINEAYKEVDKNLEEDWETRG